jgi:hypothetical protein
VLLRVASEHGAKLTTFDGRMRALAGNGKGIEVLIG